MSKYTIKTWYDMDAESPRDWCNVGTIVAWHNRYTLTDESVADKRGQPPGLGAWLADLWLDVNPPANSYSLLRPITDEGKAWAQDYREDWDQWPCYEDLRDACIDEDKRAMEEVWERVLRKADVLTIRMYEHGSVGLTVNGQGYPWNCPWDSGDVGYIYASHEKIKHESGRKRMDTKAHDWFRRIADAELETYTHYLNGEVYGYTIEDEEGEWVDSCAGYFDFDEMVKDAKAMLSDDADEIEVLDPTF